METQRTQTSQSNFEKEENKVGKLRLPDFKIHYKVTIIEAVQYWHKDMCMYMAGKNGISANVLE